MAVGFRSASASGGAVDTSTPATSVPSGAAANDIAICFVETWPGQITTITPPTGFTQKGTSGTNGCTFSSGDGQARNYVYWKRLTGADSGSYTWTFTGGSKWSTVQCMLFTGCVTSGDPFDATVATAGVTGTFGSITSQSVTTTDGNGALIFTVYNDSPGTHTPPTGFTEPAGVDVDCAACAYKLAGGATGSQTISGASISSSSAAGAWAGALLSAGGAAATSLIVPRRSAMSRGLILR